MQHWARRLEQEIDGVMRIFGGVQQLREVSPGTLCFLLRDPFLSGSGRRTSEIRSEEGLAWWDTAGPVGAGREITRKSVAPPGLGLLFPVLNSIQ